MKYSRTQWWLPKLLCLIAACAFWVYVMNEQNPVMEKHIYDSCRGQKPGPFACCNECAFEGARKNQDVQKRYDISPYG